MLGELDPYVWTCNLSILQAPQCWCGSWETNWWSLHLILYGELNLRNRHLFPSNAGMQTQLWIHPQREMLQEVIPQHLQSSSYATNDATLDTSSYSFLVYLGQYSSGVNLLLCQHCKQLYKAFPVQRTESVQTVDPVCIPKFYNKIFLIFY